MKTPEQIKVDFEANMLDGDDITNCGNAVLSAKECLEYITEYIGTTERDIKAPEDAVYPGTAFDNLLANAVTLAVRHFGEQHVLIYRTIEIGNRRIKIEIRESLKEP